MLLFTMLQLLQQHCLSTLQGTHRVARADKNSTNHTIKNRLPCSCFYCLYQQSAIVLILREHLLLSAASLVWYAIKACMQACSIHVYWQLSQEVDAIKCHKTTHVQTLLQG